MESNETFNRETSKSGKKIPQPTAAEINTFYGILNSANKKPAILKIIQPYAESFIPKLSKAQFPKPITELYDPEALKMDYIELLTECERVFDLISVSRTSVSPFLY